MVNLAPAESSIPSAKPVMRAQFGTRAGFRVRAVRSEADLTLALRARAGAYGRHWPEFGTGLMGAEAADTTPDTLVLIAESEHSGMAEGTVRIQTNFYAPVDIERELELPERFRGMPMAQISRLGVRVGAGAAAIRLALHKSIFLHCLARQVRWMLVAASPPMDRQYVSLDFVDVFEDGRRVQLSFSAGMALRVMAFDVTTAERRWRERKNPLYPYMFEGFTPEIQLFQEAPLLTRLTVRPRALPISPHESDTDSDTGAAALARRTGGFDFPVV